MSILATLFHVYAAAYRLVVTLWNAYIVLLRVMQSVMQEAKQEAVEMMTLLDDGAPVMDAITSTSLLPDTSGPTSPWQMLIIARASSFVLLFRVSKHRVLHLEVDERFVTQKLEVIRTELVLHVQHLPRLLQMPIGTHDTRLVRYTPMRLPYVWKEEQASPRCGDEVVERSVVPAASAPCVGTGSQGRSSRKKYVQLLTEGTLRRRLHMDWPGRVGLEGALKRETGVAKTVGENVVKRKALANATNAGTTMHAEGSADADGTSNEAQGSETRIADTPKQVQIERNMHAALSENLSIANMVQATSLRMADENVRRPRRSSSQFLRRKRSQFDLYVQGAPSEFSLLAKTGPGRD